LQSSTWQLDVRTTVLFLYKEEYLAYQGYSSVGGLVIIKIALDIILFEGQWI
jgi:hypothetical protein